MPELPEVEVVCRSLRKVLLGRRIQGFETDLPKMLKMCIRDSYYTMDGGDFVTGHLWFSKDEPFWYEHEEPAEE